MCILLLCTLCLALAVIQFPSIITINNYSNNNDDDNHNNDGEIETVAQVANLVMFACKLNITDVTKFFIAIYMLSRDV